MVTVRIQSMIAPTEPVQPPVAPEVTKRSDLEIKVAQLIF